MAKRKTANVTDASNADDALSAAAAKRVTVTSETARDPLNEHAAKRGIGELAKLHLDAKTAKAFTTINQADPKTVPVTELILNKDDGKLAEDTTKAFQHQATSVDKFTDKLKEAKQGLSGVLFNLAKRAAERTAEHPQYRLAFYMRLCSYAEGKAKADWKKLNASTEEPTVKAAISASWNTYKSQVGRGLKNGYDPLEFANPNLFMEASGALVIGRGRAARTPTATAGQVTAAAQIRDPMVSGVVMTLTNRLAAVHADETSGAMDKGDQIADIIMEAIHKIEALLGKGKAKGKGRATKASLQPDAATHTAM